MQEEWEIEFADSGAAALNMLDKSFGVVISDMRMPGMTGLELLNTVQERFPQTVRSLISGHSAGRRSWILTHGHISISRSLSMYGVHIRECNVQDLAVGMLLQQEIYAPGPER